MTEAMHTNTFIFYSIVPRMPPGRGHVLVLSCWVLELLRCSIALGFFSAPSCSVRLPALFGTSFKARLEHSGGLMAVAGTLLAAN